MNKEKKIVLVESLDLYLQIMLFLDCGTNVNYSKQHAGVERVKDLSYWPSSVYPHIDHLFPNEYILISHGY